MNLFPWVVVVGSAVLGVWMTRRSYLAAQAKKAAKLPRKPSRTFVFLAPVAGDRPIERASCSIRDISNCDLRGIDRQIAIRETKVGQPVMLAHDARNDADKSAIIVVTPEGVDLGYLPPDKAARYAPMMDASHPITARIAAKTSTANSAGKFLMGLKLDLEIYPATERRRSGLTARK